MTRAKTDCFAYRPGQQKPRRKAECTALDKLYCKEGECRFHKDRQDMVGYPENEYNTQNMSTGQQNEAEYPESEYGTQNISTAGKLIRAQGEQIRLMSAEEYLKDKSRETGKRNRGLLSKISTEAGKKSIPGVIDR